MHFRLITETDEIWEDVRAYAQACSWRAGASLAASMAAHTLADWERVAVALDGARICAFCTAAKTDCIPDLPYTPYVGYVFVDEAYRGNRLSERLIQFCADYLKSVGFQELYLISDHVGLYEKYGFSVIDRQMAPWGSEEKIYRKAIL
ncbi:MAG: GNAT family N-acetyltransferase [bacterium]|nr:GNAT family N-acetyltransferase [bacterium]